LVDARRTRPELLGRLPDDPLRGLDGRRVVAERRGPGEVTDPVRAQPRDIVDDEAALVPVDDAAQAGEQGGDGGCDFRHGPIIPCRSRGGVAARRGVVSRAAQNGFTTIRNTMTTTRPDIAMPYWRARAARSMSSGGGPPAGGPGGAPAGGVESSISRRRFGRFSPIAMYRAMAYRTIATSSQVRVRSSVPSSRTRPRPVTPCRIASGRIRRVATTALVRSVKFACWGSPPAAAPKNDRANP